MSPLIVRDPRLELKQNINFFPNPKEGKMKTILLFCLFWVMTTTAAMAQGTVAGSVKNVEGSAHLIRSGQTLEAEPNLLVYEQDVIKTGKSGSIGIILKDNTVLSFGPNSELKIKMFVFQPKEKDFGLSLKMLKGTASLISGTIGRVAPESVEVETPNAMLAIKGTHLLIKVL